MMGTKINMGPSAVLKNDQLTLLLTSIKTPPMDLGQLTSQGINPKEYKNKLVYLMSVEKARFRNPVIPDCELRLYIEAVRSHGRVWKYKGIARVKDKKMADAEWSATIVDRNK